MLAEQSRERARFTRMGVQMFLTEDLFALAKVGGLEVFAVCQTSNVTCGSFEESECPMDVTSKTK